MISNSNEIVENGYGNSHSVVIDKIFENIKDKNKKFPITANEGYLTSKLIHALYKSDKKEVDKCNKNVRSKRLGK